MKRRQFLTLSAAASALAFPAILTAQDKRFAEVTLRINGYGGDWDRIMQEQIVHPLERKTGLKATFTPGTAAVAIAKVLAATDDPPFDILMVDSPGMPAVLKAQVAKPVTPAEVPGLSKVLPGMREFGDFGVPLGSPSVVLACNTSRNRRPLTSFAEMARPDLKDRVGMFTLEHDIGVQQLVAMAEANGGGVDKIDPGFVALAQIKPNVATLTSSTVNMLQLLEQEEVWAAPFWDGRVISLQKAGKPIAMIEPAEGACSIVSYINLVKGTKHTEAVHAFMQESLTGGFSEALASFFGYRPSVSGVEIPSDVAERMYKPKQQKHVDWTKVAQYRADWLTRFNKEFR
ncbi:extracellular solute-binding protein [Bradyrhizobium sp. RT11b]|uniref:extracellular solute-binding protein n=1 Tax=Bradyrhizobium sp. RT11b TaxID=3156332 RepID=UPI00339455E5